MAALTTASAALDNARVIADSGEISTSPEPNDLTMTVKAVRDALQVLPDAVPVLTEAVEPAREALSEVRAAMKPVTDAVAAARVRENPGKRSWSR
jgi:hypothetical protein